MGQIKKLMPKSHRDRIFNFVDKRLPEESFARENFANGISIGGTVMVAAGTVLDFAGHRKTGAALRAVGETGDDFDGDAARRLGTAGRGGALLDAVVDKLKVGMELAVLWKHSTEAAYDSSQTDRRGRLAVIAGKHVSYAALNSYIEFKGGEGKSLEPGKINAYVDTLTAASWGIADAAESEPVRAAFNTIGNIGFVAGLGTGAHAFITYAKEAMEVRNQEPAVAL